MAIAMETVLIRVDAQTDGAIQATNRLTAAQEKLAEGFRAATAVGDDMMSKLGDGMKALPSSIGKVGEVLKSAGFDVKTFSQGVKDIGKGMTFDLLRTGLKELKGNINGTADAALSAAIQGASMGAAFGGPWGAAIGGAAGAVKGLVSSLLDADAEMQKHRDAMDAQAKAYWDAIHAAEKKKQIEDELAPTLAKVAEEERRLAERTAIANKATNESEDAYSTASAKASVYAKKLQDINYEIRHRLELEGKLPADLKIDYLAGQQGEEADAIRSKREERDAQLEMYAAGKSYGVELLKIAKAENERADRLQDLEYILADINAGQVGSPVQQAALKEYNELLGVTEKKLEKVAARFSDVATVTGMDQQGRSYSLGSAAGYAGRVGVGEYDARLGVAANTNDSGIAEELARQDALNAAYEQEVGSRASRYAEFANRQSESKLEKIFGPADEFSVYQELFKGLGDAIGGTYEVIVTGQGSASAALKKLAADSIMATGKRAAVEAAHELAMAAGSVATGNLAGAGAHAIAAAKYAAVAVAAGVVAHELGAGGGTTAPPKATNDNSDSGGDGKPGQSTYIVAYLDPFANQPEYLRRQQAREMVQSVTGGSAVEHS